MTSVLRLTQHSTPRRARGSSKRHQILPDAHVAIQKQVSSGLRPIERAVHERDNVAVSESISFSLNRIATST